MVELVGLNSRGICNGLRPKGQLSDFVVPGSTGQPKVHPLLAEVRAHRQLLERLTEALNLPDDAQLIGDRAGSRRTRAAVRARWNRQVS